LHEVPPSRTSQYRARHARHHVRRPAPQSGRDALVALVEHALNLASAQPEDTELTVGGARLPLD
jgi:hypothetical protein